MLDNESLVTEPIANLRRATMANAPMRKTYPVFDCDAHINDPFEIWTKYVEPEYR